MIDKIKAYVGFAIKSNKIVYGVDNILLSRQVHVVIYDVDLADNSLSKLTKYLENNNIEGLKTDKLKEIVNRDNCKVIGIKDKNLSKAILSYKESF